MSEPSIPTSFIPEIVVQGVRGGGGPGTGGLHNMLGSWSPVNSGGYGYGFTPGGSYASVRQAEGQAAIRNYFDSLSPEERAKYLEDYPWFRELLGQPAAEREGIRGLPVPLNEQHHERIHQGIMQDVENNPQYRLVRRDVSPRPSRRGVWLNTHLNPGWGWNPQLSREFIRRVTGQVSPPLPPLPSPVDPRIAARGPVGGNPDESTTDRADTNDVEVRDLIDGRHRTDDDDRPDGAFPEWWDDLFPTAAQIFADFLPQFDPTTITQDLRTLDSREEAVDRIDQELTEAWERGELSTEDYDAALRGLGINRTIGEPPETPESTETEEETEGTEVPEEEQGFLQEARDRLLRVLNRLPPTDELLRQVLLARLPSPSITIERSGNGDYDLIIKLPILPGVGHIRVPLRENGQWVIDDVIREKIREVGNIIRELPERVAERVREIFGEIKEAGQDIGEIWTDEDGNIFTDIIDTAGRILETIRVPLNILLPGASPDLLNILGPAIIGILASGGGGGGGGSPSAPGGGPGGPGGSPETPTEVPGGSPETPTEVPGGSPETPTDRPGLPGGGRETTDDSRGDTSDTPRGLPGGSSYTTTDDQPRLPLPGGGREITGEGESDGPYGDASSPYGNDTSSPYTDDSTPRGGGGGPYGAGSGAVRRDYLRESEPGGDIEYYVNPYSGAGFFATPEENDQYAGVLRELLRGRIASRNNRTVRHSRGGLVGYPGFTEQMMRVMG